MFFCIVLLFYGIYPDLNKMNDWILAQIMQLKQKKTRYYATYTDRGLLSPDHLGSAPRQALNSYRLSLIFIN